VQADGAGQVVEGEDLLAPAGTGEPLGLLREEGGAGGDDEDVVGHPYAAAEVHRPRVQVDPLDACLFVVHGGVQLLRAGADKVVRLGRPEGDEQQAGLVDVVVVLVHDGDPAVVLVIHAAQPVGRQCASGAASEYHDVCAHGPTVVRETGPGHGPQVPIRYPPGYVFTSPPQARRATHPA